MAAAGRRTAGRPWGPLTGDDPAARNVAAYLRQLIDGADLTLRQLADACGCSSTTMSTRLNGQRLPSDQLIEQIISTCIPDARRAQAVMANLATIRQTSARSTPSARSGRRDEHDDPRSRIIRAQGETVSVLRDLTHSQQVQIDLQHRLIEAERAEKLAALRIASLEAEIARLQAVTADATRLRDLYLAQAQRHGAQLQDAQQLLVLAHQREDQAGRQLATSNAEQQHAAREVARIKLTLEHFERLARTLSPGPAPAARNQPIDTPAGTEATTTIDSLVAELSQIDEALRRIETDLSASARWVGHAMRAVPEAVVVTDIDGIIVSCNVAAEKLFGWSVLEAIGRSWLALCIAPSAVPTAADLHHIAATGREHEDVLAIRARDGRLPKARLRAIPLRAESMGGTGTVEGVVLMADDSEQVRPFSPGFAQRVLSQARQQLAASSDTLGALPAIATLLVPAFGDWCEIAVVDDQGSVRRVVTVRGDGDVDIAAAATADVPPGFPAWHLYATVLRSQQSVVEYAVGGEGGPDGPEWGLLGLPGNASRLLVVPLRASRTIRGVMAVASASRPTYSDDDVALLEEVATRCALALEMDAYDQRGRQASLAARDALMSLQHSMLPTRLPTVQGAAVAVSYEPDVLGHVGGDLYDILALPTGRIGVLIGDVAGRGLHASAVMGQLRAAVRSYAVLDVTPAQLLAHVNDILGDLGGDLDRLSTLQYAVYDPFTRRCTLANAGHPPPLLLMEEGCYPMEVPADPPLGIGRGEYTEHTFSLPPGCTMVLYTDGVIETRANSVDLGVRRLCESIEKGPADLVALCETALRCVSTEQVEDDRAVLTLRTEQNDLPYSHVVLADRRQATDTARTHVRHTLSQWHLTESVPTADKLVVELVDNAIRHAIPRGRGIATGGAGAQPVPAAAGVAGAGPGPTVALKKGSGSLWIEVHDDDPRLPVAPGPSTAATSGLLRVDSLAARWGSRRTHSGKVVWCEIIIGSVEFP